jgi:hypothetical protein
VRLGKHPQSGAMGGTDVDAGGGFGAFNLSESDIIQA